MTTLSSYGNNLLGQVYFMSLQKCASLKWVLHYIRYKTDTIVLHRAFDKHKKSKMKIKKMRLWNHFQARTILCPRVKVKVTSACRRVWCQLKVLAEGSRDAYSVSIWIELNLNWKSEYHFHFQMFFPYLVYVKLLARSTYK